MPSFRQKMDFVTKNQKIVQRHYKLPAPPSLNETVAEIENLKRRGIMNLDDSQQRLAAALNVFE